MNVRNDASKMVILYNTRQETERCSSSDFRLRSYVLFVVKNWVTGKEAVNH